MPINIGNKSLKEVYISDTPIKKIYVGSDLVWNAVPPIPDGYVRLTVHFDFADFETKQRFLNDSGYFKYETYTDDDDIYDNIGTPWCDFWLYPNQIDAFGNLYIDVLKGDYLYFGAEGFEGDYGTDSINGYEYFEYHNMTENVTATIPIANTQAHHVPLTITVDTSAAPEDLAQHYINIFADGKFVESVYFDEMEAGAANCNNYFINNQYVASVPYGSVLTFEYWNSYVETTIQIKCNGVDINQKSIAINGTTEISFVVTTIQKLIITLDTGLLDGASLSGHAFILYVNGEWRVEVWCEEGAGEYCFTNNQFVYDNVVNGDVITWSELYHAADDTDIFITTTGSITINDVTNLTFILDH